MQIIIPMSGSGERFRRAGYKVPKPLIEVEGKPIIAHVVDLFPGEQDVLFICNRDHLAEPAWNMAGMLAALRPAGTVAAIEPHGRGPVHAVLAAADHVKPDEPVIVSYCDYAGLWDYAAFRAMTETTACDGALMAYTGFHPHMLRNHHYGYVQMDGTRVAAIQEKQPYTDNPMSEYALSGGYYFRTGALMLEVMRALEERDDLQINGEHYVSLAYRPLLERGADIRVAAMDHFMQWGTPEDLTDFTRWSSLLRSQMQEPSRAQIAGSVVVPMAGRGRRFADEGYDAPKPLIPVTGRPMAVQALGDLPRAERVRAVLRRDLPGLDRLQKSLRLEVPGIDIALLESLTEGQAITALEGLAGMHDETMVTFGACDHGMIYDAAALARLLADPAVDAIVWAVRGHPQAAQKPQAYGWVDADGAGRIRNVSVKVPLADPAHDPVVTGTFTFRRAGDFRRAVARMQGRNARVNGEFYIDTAINDACALGLDCRLFAIDHYLGWGTPNELRSYEYWQNCLDRWNMHPYSLAGDPDRSRADTQDMRSA
ncbi:MAG: NTP transferase domain-containing protein [Alphaproteobacteria bacterium]|nr:NTP transferase domain-containing protein [Alphaproteobacteria bacterium]